MKMDLNRPMRVNWEMHDHAGPHDLDAERQVVGSLLLEPRRIRDIAGLLTPEDFHSQGYGTIFRHLCAADDAGERVDATLLADRLKRASELQTVGGLAGIVECLQSTPVADHAIHYARIVARKAAYRRNIAAGWALVEASHAEQEEPESITAAVLAALQSGDDLRSDKGPTPMVDAAVQAFERFEQVAERKKSFGYATGLVAFDEMHGGLFPGELFVIAARPALGKTSLACQIAWNFAAARRPVYFASAEMSATELASRIICGQSGVNSRRVRTGTLSSEDLSQLSTSAQPLGQMPWYVDDCNRLTTSRIRRCARKVAKSGLSLIVVDYLGRLTPENSTLRRHEQIAEMTRELKSVSRELDVPVLCLVQLNRESQKESRPRLHHLSDSSEVEKEADVISFLHEPPKARAVSPSDPGLLAVDWSIDKNRNGEVGRIELEFIRERTLFVCAGERVETFAEFDAFA